MSLLEAGISRTKVNVKSVIGQDGLTLTSGKFIQN